MWTRRRATSFTIKTAEEEEAISRTMLYDETTRRDPRGERDYDDLQVLHLSPRRIAVAPNPTQPNHLNIRIALTPPCILPSGP